MSAEPQGDPGTSGPVLAPGIVDPRDRDWALRRLFEPAAVDPRWRSLTPWVVVIDPMSQSDQLVGCLIDIAVSERLRQEAKPGIDVVVAHDGERRQQLHLMIRGSCAASIRAYLDGGGRSVHGWLDQQRVSEVAMPDLAASFRDLDAPGDLD